MKTLDIRFPKNTITLRLVPKGRLNIVATARHKNFLVLKADDGNLYSTSLGWSNGAAVCDWWHGRALDFLPCLYRLGVLPEGCSIKAASLKFKTEEKAGRRHHDLVELRNVCQRLGVKTPKVPKLRA